MVWGTWHWNTATRAVLICLVYGVEWFVWTPQGHSSPYNAVTCHPTCHCTWTLGKSNSAPAFRTHMKITTAGNTGEVNVIYEENVGVNTEIPRIQMSHGKVFYARDRSFEPRPFRTQLTQILLRAGKTLYRLKPRWTGEHCRNSSLHTNPTRMQGRRLD